MATHCVACADRFSANPHCGAGISVHGAASCAQMTPAGCRACVSGTFILDGACFPCARGCVRCADASVCGACAPDRILRAGACVSRHDVDGCVAVAESRCVRCSGVLARPSGDGTACVDRVYIVFVAVGVVFFLSFLSVRGVASLL